MKNKKLVPLLICFLTACTTANPTPTATQPSTNTPPSTATNTPIPTHTPTPIPLYDLEGSIFFDYNGNGEWDEGEPPIAGFGICAKPNGAEEICVDTDENGGYIFEGLAPDNTRVTVSFTDPNADVPELAFRYLSLSVEEFQPITNSPFMEMNGDTRKDWGLLQGFLTLPFECSTKYMQSLYVDLDTDNGIRDWNNQNFTRNGHLGIDYDMKVGQSIIAPAPGVVIEAEGNWPNNPNQSKPELGLKEDGNRIAIQHDGGQLSLYAHLGDLLVSVGDSVYRGQPIALSGNTGYKTEGPHLHFQFGDYGIYRVDPYRDVLEPNSVSWWTVDNTPQCIPGETDP